MTKRLGDDDARAVDLLLNKTNTAKAGTGGRGNGGARVYATPVGDAVAGRIGVVESMFRLLAEMPAADPAPDLVARTLNYVQRRATAVPGHALEPQPSRPVILDPGPQ